MPGIGLPGCTLPWTFDACCISLRSGQLGIRCLLDFLVRTRAVSRHRSVQRPSTHLGGLPQLLFEVSSNASVCSRALLVDSRSACAAGHELHVQLHEGSNLCAYSNFMPIVFSQSPNLCAGHFFSASSLFAACRCCLQQCLRPTRWAQNRRMRACVNAF